MHHLRVGKRVNRDGVAVAAAGRLLGGELGDVRFADVGLDLDVGLRLDEAIALYREAAPC